MLLWPLQELIVIHCIPIILVFGQTTLMCESPYPKWTKNCNCTVKGMSFPTAINLCSLDRDFHFVLPDTSHDGMHSMKKPSSINVLRYCILNAFGRIEPYPQIQNTTTETRSPCWHKSLTTTNCPSYSMCCLVSCVSFECNAERGSSNDAACIAPQLNADAYGHYGKWHIRQPSNSKDDRNVKGSVAVIQINAGPCYFCDIRSDGMVHDLLYTLIGLYCDERIMDHGHPVLVNQPSSTKPRLVFKWNTSQACYNFSTNEQCLDIKRNSVCKDKTFSCSSKNYHFRFPVFAKHSITKSLTDNVKYTFGFCANNIDCSSTGTTPENEGVMICRKDIYDNTVKPVAYYNDDIQVILRPTGFVWRIKSKVDSLKYKAVVSFQCSDQSSEKIDLNVLEDKKLPVLLTLKHKCFCPNPQAECQGSPTANPYVQPTTGSQTSKLLEEVLIPIIFGVSGLVLFVLWYRLLHDRRRQIEHTNPPGNSTASRQPQEDPPPGSPPSNSSSLSYHTPPSSLSGLPSTSSTSRTLPLTQFDSPTERTSFLPKPKNRKKHSTV